MPNSLGIAIIERRRQLWVVEVIAPFGGAEEMLKDLKAKLFREREIRLLPWQPG